MPDNASTARSILSAALLKSDLFDTDYYRSRFMIDQAAADAEVADHFLRFGNYDLRSPGPRFDGWEYVQTNPDVQSSGANPFLHYARWGEKEGRLTRSLPERRVGSAKRLHELVSNRDGAETAEPRQPLKVAVLVHLYYADYLPLFKERLAAVPEVVDVFVSCPDRDTELQAYAALSEVVTGRLEARVVPNIGRNIAPLFVAFAADLADYDLIGHVHTKKSLYTGRTRTDWAFHLISGVLGTPDYMRSVLDLFAADESVGLLSSEIFYDLPFWAFHLLRNEGVFKDLCRRLGLPSDVEFVDYPVGGMFWMRGDILRKINELKLSYGDFPGEHGQTDGTLHHAVERLIGHVCAELGLRFVKYSPRHGMLFEEERPWRASYEGISRQARIDDALIHFDTVSFDLFDTLVMRDCADVEYAKVALSLEEASRSFAPYRDYQEFRNACELAARVKLDWQGDVSWIEIATEMARTGIIDVTTALRLLEREAALDLEVLQPRRAVIDMLNRLRASGRRTIIVSDTYYPEFFISRILAKAGIANPDRLYLSSVARVRKDRGDMWSQIKTDGLGRIVHFGDNMVSDVQNPEDHGIKGVYLLKAVEKVLWLDLLAAPPTEKSWKIARDYVSRFGDEPFFL